MINFIYFIILKNYTCYILVKIIIIYRISFFIIFALKCTIQRKTFGSIVSNYFTVKFFSFACFLQRNFKIIFIFILTYISALVFIINSSIKIYRVWHIFKRNCMFKFCTVFIVINPYFD